MAEKLNNLLYTVSCHDDLTAADLIDRHFIGPNGTYRQDGPLTKAVRDGGDYIDEIASIGLLIYAAQMISISDIKKHKYRAQLIYVFFIALWWIFKLFFIASDDIIHTFVRTING